VLLSQFLREDILYRRFHHLDGTTNFLQIVLPTKSNRASRSGDSSRSDELFGDCGPGSGDSGLCENASPATVANVSLTTAADVSPKTDHPIPQVMVPRAGLVVGPETCLQHC